jgi:cytochrome d ubiquinol oxidase subunit I
MEVSGPIIGVAFAMEGFAFFMEAIFLGIFLYGRDRLPPAIHTAVGFIVALAGACSAVFVVATNAWMNFPLADASDPFKEVFGSPMFFQMAVHLVLGSYVACFGLVAGVHAIILLSKKMFKKFHVQDYEVHHKAFKVAAIAMSLLIPLQLVSGDYSAKVIAKSQPAKFAAMEALFKTQEAAPLSVGGIADVKERKLKYAIEIPHALSFLAHGDFNTAVTGLEEFPEEDWPIVNVVHLAFDTMVGSGSLMLLLGLITLFKVFIQRTGLLSSKLWLAYALATPLGLIAIETGWIVTEVGRQPWIIYGRMRTIDAVTTSAELGPYFYGYAALYIILLSTMILVMQRIFRDKV